MKKISILLLIFCIFFTACGKTNESTDKIITSAVTNSQQNSLAENETTLTDKTQETPKNADISDSDKIIKELFETEKSDVQVDGSGTVTKILEDDNDGSRHQRFILSLESGQTLIIAHNIDLAPRLENLKIGDIVEFYGEYYYTEEGGGIHWTHADPDRNHADGYLKFNGTLYQSTEKDETTKKIQTTAEIETTEKIETTVEIQTTEKIETNAETEQTYIGNKNSKVLHSENCANLPANRNRVYFSDIDEALGQGFHKHYDCRGN
jgi:hypothetical protein